ncbi:DUF1254 domain-containing protein [Solirubrobacter ginsenosidimutans]|uniref:DUF1254 domain-containing protein n=1 Tax=Solirubrobacter ginsenosidimutans TaxID=490573 RepID=A0A9X3MLB5_9ACTN|nr:DUF1254 domain-containing protein [Solirubrobacter ginsenosidimutans]MDA0158646.1 DUF1254 domain-containing protein [Solirubrobacter ginsenosidimutans]
MHTATLPAGFPAPATIERAYDQADLNRAIQAYRFFFPTVSGLAMVKGNEPVGLVDNRVFGQLDTQPRHVGFTLNSDTPYGPIPLDLRDGPMVIELPAGPLICVALDLNQRWVADMGLPGPDAGRGGKHLLLPPGYEGEIPDGYHAARATTYRVIAGVRSLPVGGDVEAAMARIATIRVHPLHADADWAPPTFVNFSDRDQDTTPLRWETTLEFWRALHEVIDTEPRLDEFRILYGELAALGIACGKPFAPDERMTRILEQAAVTGNEQMRVQAFADRRPDRVVWPDRQWEWAALRFEDGDFYADGYLDVDAREKWFFQAIASSPAMFRRGAGAGSVYWLGLRDASGAYLDGSQSYRLRVPLPVPGKLFWSVTVYDAVTRSQIRTEQGHAALRSLFELADADDSGHVDLLFGPHAPGGQTDAWIRTIPNRGWFVYFRVYGPETSSFDGSWKPGDFELL